MQFSILKFLFLISVLFFVAGVSSAQQVDAANSAPQSTEKNRDEPRSFGEILARHRSEQDKKDHEAMLERGNEALKISEQLEESYEKNKSLTREDKQQLDNLERIVIKIRKELGASEDDEDAKLSQPADLEDAFKFVQSNASKMVDELKKTTRFSISASAIQASNTLLWAVRLLRIKK